MSSSGDSTKPNKESMSSKIHQYKYNGKKKSRTSKNREAITNKVTERHTIAAPEEEKGEQSAEQIFTVITADSCPKLMWHSKPQMQEAQ